MLIIVILYTFVFTVHAHVPSNGICHCIAFQIVKIRLNIIRLNAILYIKRDVTDRRSSLIKHKQKNNRQVFRGQGGYFFASFPKVYPSPKHVKPKLTNATKSIILIWHPPPPIFFVTSKCNRRVRMPSQESRTAYRYGNIHLWILSYFFHSEKRFLQNTKTLGIDFPIPKV